MNITLENVGKRFNTEWIFRNLDFEFSANTKYAITGPNGSGKSTLLQLIGGYILLNEGAIFYRQESKTLEPEKIQTSIALSAPYLEVIEEMSLQEFLSFHFSMKPCIAGISINDIAGAVSLSSAINKQIRYYSSGMKQRVKLAQAIFSDVPVILLDEPLTNLDAEGVTVYYSLIQRYASERMVIVSSNDEKEFNFCTEQLNINDFK